MPRLAEALVVEEGMKKPLVENSTIYQIGGQAKHRPEELVFSVNLIYFKYCLLTTSIDLIFPYSNLL